jgi:threonine/homoserine/homoserine lactone efflux protein
MMANLYPFLVYVCVTSFTPGPNNVMSMVNGMRYSYMKMFRFLAGIIAGFFIVLLVSGLLNVALVSLLPSIEIWLKYIGVVYMVYLAIHIIRSKPVESTEGDTAYNTFKFGFAMQFLNVKVILYGITVYSLFIVNRYKDLLSISLFALVLSAVGFAAVSCWALGGNLFSGFLQKHYRIFNLAMGGLLIYTAVASLI